MTATTLPSRLLCYTGAYGNGSASWCGKAVDDRRRFVAFLHDVVGRRVTDEESGFAADLRGLATTDMATEQVERLLRAVPDPKGWEIGEALAECVLREDSGYEMHWPWNTAAPHGRACRGLIWWGFAGWMATSGSPSGK